MTTNERRRLDALRRRHDRLSELLADWHGGDPGRARAERGALRWAIRLIEEADEAGILDELRDRLPA